MVHSVSSWLRLRAGINFTVGSAIPCGPGPAKRYNASVANKNCFIDKSRPCDLTCKAAFPVDDAVDPVDCYLIWLAAHVGDGAIDFRRMLESQGLGDGPEFPAGGTPGGGPGGGGPGGGSGGGSGGGPKSGPPGTGYSPN